MIFRPLTFLWVHTRDIAVRCSEKTIRYSIPLYSERPILGKLVSAKIIDGSLHLTFNTSLVTHLHSPDTIDTNKK